VGASQPVGDFGPIVFHGYRDVNDSYSQEPCHRRFPFATGEKGLSEASKTGALQKGGQAARGEISLDETSTVICANPRVTISWKAMADDKFKTGGQDRGRINVNEDYELRDWSRKLGITPERRKKSRIDGR
jgi:hypothetical protein